MAKTARLSLRISDELNKKILRLAKQQQRSMNNISEILLTNAVDSIIKREATMKK